MNRQNTQNYQMLTRVADFATNYVGLFPKTTAAPDILSALGAAVATLSDQASTRVSAEATIRTNCQTRIAARETLRTRLQRAEQTGRAVNSDKFRMPAKRTDQALINSRHAFAVDAEPLNQTRIAAAGHKHGGRGSGTCDPRLHQRQGETHQRDSGV